MSDIACRCGAIITEMKIQQQIDQTHELHPSARIVGVQCNTCGAVSDLPSDMTAPSPKIRCGRCGTLKELMQTCPKCPKKTLSAADAIFWMRHHCQLGLGELAKLAQSGSITKEGRAAIEGRLYNAMNLADAYEGAPRVPDPPEDELAKRLRASKDALPPDTEPS